MSSLTILLLGSPEISVDGEPSRLGRRKALALLAYLAGNPAIHPRDSLATLLWPQSDRNTARANLRRTLSILITSLGREHFEVDRESVRLCDEAHVDLAEFNRLVALNRRRWSGDGSADEASKRLAQLAAAAELVRGPFLEGFSLDDSVLFDDWQMLQAESINQTLVDLLAQLTAGYRSLAKPDQALAFARRWVTLDPYHAEANRSTMALLAETDQSAAALRHFRAYERLLDEELGLRPDATVAALFEAIRNGCFVPAYPSAGQETAGAEDGPPPSNLPGQVTSFIGRSQEIGEIDRLLCDEPDCRLVTLTGAGGVGKTRLAVAAAYAVSDRFPDGVCFVPLVGMHDAIFAPSAIADALGLQVPSASIARDALLAYLRCRSVLLVLDNVEQLIGAQDESFTPLVLDLLATAPELRLLVTSRLPLDTQAEWVMPVAGLGYPENEAAAAPVIEQYEAISLFYHRARRLRPDFDWRGEWRAMARICRAVNGMPLAIELAAPWVQSLSCEEIADQIEQDMDLLATTLRDVEPRHRSIRHVFEQTWQMLSAEERHVLSRLSVFRSGCTRLAAEQVAGATLPLLLALTGKTLLRRGRDGRYDSQELLRQFCADKLAADPAALERTRDRHSVFFMSLLAHRYEALLLLRTVETYHELRADLENIHTAWARATEQGNLAALSSAFEVYWQFLDYRGAGDEIIAIFRQTAERLEGLRCDDENEERLRRCLLGEILVPYGQRIAANLGRDQEGTAAAERGLALIRRADPSDRRKLFWAFCRIEMLYLDSAPDKAKRICEECINLCRETDDRFGLSIAHTIAAWHYVFARDLRNTRIHTQLSLEYSSGFATNCWSLLALELQSIMSIYEGQYIAADEVAQETIRFARRLDKYFNMINAFHYRALLARIAGNYEAARALYKRARRLVEPSGVPSHEVLIILQLSALARLAGDNGKAAHLLAEAEVLYDRLAMPNQASILAEKGRLAFSQGDFPTSEAHLRRAATGGLLWLPHDNFDSSLVDLGDALCAQGKPDARSLFCRALRKSRDEGTLPRALQALGGLARFFAQNGDPERALALALMVRDHPITWHEHRVQAAALIQQVERTMAAEAIEAMRQRMATRDVWDVVDEILVTFPTSMD